MANEWTKVRLSDCGDLRNGVNFSQAQEGSGIPIIKVKDFHDRFFAPIRGLDELSARAVSIPEDQILQSGDTVIIRSNGNPNLVGRCLYVQEIVRPTTFSGFCIRFRPNRSVLEPRFASYLLRSPLSRRHFVSHGTGTGIQNLNQGAISSLAFHRPSIEEQQAINRVLGCLDDKIELNRQTNQTLESLAHGIFRYWFVDFDPIVAKADGRKPFGMTDEVLALFPERFVDSKIGPIPEGWSVGSLIDLARYINGRNFTHGATGTGRMVIRIAELNSGPGSSTIFNDVEAPSDQTAYPDDILFSWSGSLGIYRWHNQEALINQHIFKVICAEYPRWFVYFHLLEALPFLQNIAADKATTMGHIKRDHLGEVKMALPPHPLLCETSFFIQPLYEQIHLGEVESRSLADLRDLLLPKLLSGEIRLRQAEKAVERVL